MNLLQQDVRTLLSSPKEASSTPRPASGSSSSPRTHERVHAPIGPAAISGKLHLPGGETYPVKLWDVSDRGLCLHTRQPLPLAPDDAVRLELIGALPQDHLQLVGTIRWVDTSKGSSMHFLGLRLDDPAPDLRQTFLRPLLGNS